MKFSHLRKIGLSVLRNDDDRKTELLLDMKRSCKECDLFRFGEVDLEVDGCDLAVSSNNLFK